MILFPVSHSCQLHTTLLNLLTILPTILKRQRPIRDFLNYATLRLKSSFYASFSIPLHLFWYKSIMLSVKSCPIFATPWTAAHQASLSFTISWSLLRLMSIESMMPSNHLILCHSPSSSILSLFSIRVFSSELEYHCFLLNLTYSHMILPSLVSSTINLKPFSYVIFPTQKMLLSFL